MQKAGKHVRAVISRILFIGLSIQVILGLLWMCCSFDGVQAFAETSYYIEVSDSLLCDDYTGILYPFILMLVRRLDQLLGIPYGPVMYLLQIGLALVAGYTFVSAFGVKERLWKLWGSLVLLTFPMTMQCHMAILPNSMAYSCFLLMMAFVVIREYVGMSVFWILAALFLPEYLYLGAVPVGIVFLYILIKARRERAAGKGAAGKSVAGKNAAGKGAADRSAVGRSEPAMGRKILCYLAIAAASVAVIGGVNALTQEAGSQGRVHNSAEAAWFRRTAWTSLGLYYHLWPQEVKDAVSGEDFEAADFIPENMTRVLQPRIEEALGVEEARIWFGELGTVIFLDNYPQILHEMMIDLGGYLLPPVITDILLEGRGYSTYCARNYEVMRQEHPLLTRYYMDYGIWWFVVGIVLMAVMESLKIPAWILHKALDRNLQGSSDKSSDGNSFAFFTCVASAGAMALWYTLQEAGLWDCKKALFVGGLWMLWMIKGAYTIALEKERR